MKLTKLLITGGHPTPALAVIDELRATHPEVYVVMVGRQHANSRETNNTYEFDEAQLRGVEFIPVDFGRGLSSLLKVPAEILESKKLLARACPDAVLSFGGYIAFPVACAARWLGIPVFTHEQTAVTGRANELIQLFATKVFLSFVPPAHMRLGSKYIWTGNPIRSEITHPDTSTAPSLEVQKPLLLISGGNLGSHSLNTHIFSIVSKLVDFCTVVHQTGNVDEYGDEKAARDILHSLPVENRSRYIPVPHLPTSDWAYVLQTADVVVTRSGANTFFELVATQKPCVLVPLPWSVRDEQKEHAVRIASAGAGEIFDQTSDSLILLELIKKVFENPSNYAKKYHTLLPLYVPDAARKIIAEIINTQAKA